MFIPTLPSRVAAVFAAVDAKLVRATTASEREAFDSVLARLEEVL